VRTFFGQGRVSSSGADVRSYWCKKTSNFSKFMMRLHEQERLSSANIFLRREEGVSFSRFCTNVTLIFKVYFNTKVFFTLFAVI